MVDRFLIDALTRTSLILHEPRDAGPVLYFDEAWEGPFSAYFTVIRDNTRLRLYYRGWATTNPNADKELQHTCVAESADGVNWTKPRLGLIDLNGSTRNNVILSYGQSIAAHNFSPFLDANPAAKPDQRYKALGGDEKAGLLGFVSPDGLRWRPLDRAAISRDMVPTEGLVFDSQNLAHWSVAEGKYVAYFRTWENKFRQIYRAESHDFCTWTCLQPMRMIGPNGEPAPVEQFYTNQTAPYFRAPHLSIALAARFMRKRRALSEEDALSAQVVDPRYLEDISDSVFMTTRGGTTYDRTFMEGFIRPGTSPSNWTSRTNYPALNIVQTGEEEMSLYLNQDYAQPTAHLRRYTLPLDRFASIRAGYGGGEVLTKPFTFTGSTMLLNYSTSAAGGIRVELQDDTGRPIPGFSLDDSVELIGNKIEGPVRWNTGTAVLPLAGRTIRARFVMKDADVFALRFA
jgi:hypothetical protein